MKLSRRPLAWHPSTGMFPREPITPPLGHALTMDHLAQLGAAALDALGAAKAAIVGCSMGGYASMAFARSFPQRMNAAVLIAAGEKPALQNSTPKTQPRLQVKPTNVAADQRPFNQNL